MSRLRRWRLTPQHEGGAALAAALGVSPLIGQLLVNRGIEDPGQATDFLGARLDQHLRSPMLFRDMARASERLVDALGRGERIGIYGDYDVDGVSGSALLVRFLRSVGAQPEPVLHIPHRLRDGYGLGASRHRAPGGGGRAGDDHRRLRRRQPPRDRARQRARHGRHRLRSPSGGGDAGRRRWR